MLLKRLNWIIPGFLLVFATSCEKDPVISSPPNAAQVDESQFISGQYIIEMAETTDDLLFKATGDFHQVQSQLSSNILSKLSKSGINDVEIGAVYSNVFKGFAVKIDNAQQLEQLQKMPGVIGIEADQLYTISQAKDNGSEFNKAQITQYGVNRVGFASGVGKRVWIVDTGIDMDHPDLTVNAALSKSFVTNFSLLGGVTYTKPEDGNGHGTHCAGIVAAKNNSIGVVGVAYGAEVVAIKVLADNGSGSTSAIISALDYIATKAKPGEVVNMSLGGGASTSLDNAVSRVAAKGILFAIAAGNSRVSATTQSPARVNGNNIYTISAMDKFNNWASYSNFGNPPVDYCAPGSAVYSTYKNGGYATLSGTSMAAPHVAGILLLRGKPATSGRVNGDPDGNPDYIAHL